MKFPVRLKLSFLLLKNYFDFVVKRVEKIKHQHHVFQKGIGQYYRFFFIEVNTDMGKKLNEAKEAITPPIAKKNIDTINKTEKSQAPPPPKR